MFFHFRRLFFLFFLTFILSSCGSKSSDENTIIQTPNPEPAVEYIYSFSEEPEWSDEFEVDGLPSDKIWSYDVGGGGWGNDEKQFYTEADLDNARVEGGKLVITALKEEIGGRGYSSARLVTKNKKDFTFGKVVVRAKLPSGRGTWPAIWTLASQTSYGDIYWPDQGEIDIMEHVGMDPTVVHATVHTKLYNHLLNTQRGNRITIGDYDTEFHDYAIEWTPKEIKASVDGTYYFTFSKPSNNWGEWPFDKPQHLLLNIAIGGNWAGQKGIDNLIFPTSMVIDYVRYYSLIQIKK